MKIKYIKCPEPVETPCLMKSEFGEVFLVTDGLGNEKYVTRVSSGNVETWESDLKGYTPLPKGTKVKFTN